MSKFAFVAVGALAFAGLSATQAAAQAKPTRAQNQQAAAVSEVPHCAQKLGTLAIANGDTAGWRAYNLEAPEKLLKVIVQRSGCFDLVDRGAGLAAAEKERNIGGNLGLQRGSNVGTGQVKAADYVLVAEVAAKNGNAGGNAVAGIAGGLIGGRVGGLVGGIKTQKLEANTVLSLTNVRTTETVAVQEGYFAKTDIGWGAGGGIFAGGGFGGAVGGGYENTDIGKVVTISFVDAYSKLVNGLGGMQPGAAQAAPTRSFTVAAPTTMRKTPASNGAVVRSMPAGLTVYPTGNKQDIWWEIVDDNDNSGWVQNDKLTAGK